MAGSFSARLAELRKSRGTSQKEAAKNLGISQALLSHYEKGIREPSLDFVCKASRFYNVTSDYLLGLSESRTTIGESFDENDLSQDSQLTLSTIYRAASVLRKNLSKNAAPLCDVQDFLSVGLYRLISASVAAGNLPAEWLGFEPDAAYELSNLTSARIIGNINSEKKSKPSKPVREPVCVKTVISSAESVFEDVVASIKPIK
jgi:transcriptional regulator with XRE-family HTH domain